MQARSVTTGFEDVHFIHRSLPEINLKDVNASTAFLGHTLTAPLLISGMTGGTAEALKINATLAEVAERLHLPMGVGSQRAAVERDELTDTYSVAREKAPTAFLMANLGAAQLIKGYSAKEAQKAIDMIRANALVMHLNVLQESAQPEGDTDYAGVLAEIKKLTSGLKVPVIAKETGAGISAEDARMLETAGVKGLDVAGAGGTSWSAVETYRSKSAGRPLHVGIGETFWDWGIPTAASVAEVRHAVKAVVIASGGMRNGLDAAKAIALGADAVGFAYPLFKAALEGVHAVEFFLQRTMVELKTAMFLTGAKDISQLKTAPLVITGRTAEWLRIRGLDPTAYGRR
ncbi:MAG: type 2 isopentenyl-diphosphate Delta-isomerase [Candidatus Bathyarchaeia archaeon]